MKYRPPNPSAAASHHKSGWGPNPFLPGRRGERRGHRRRLAAGSLIGLSICAGSLEACRVFAYIRCRVFVGAAIVRKSKTLKQKIEYRMARRLGDDVFLPREFADLAGDDQVLRALRMLVKEGRLMRLGYGVYARAMRSRLSGRSMVDSANGFSSAALQALTKLGVPWEPSDSVSAYNEARSTQIPVNPAVKVKGRFRRRLSDGRAELRIER